MIRITRRSGRSDGLATRRALTLHENDRARDQQPDHCPGPDERESFYGLRKPLLPGLRDDMVAKLVSVDVRCPRRRLFGDRPFLAAARATKPPDRVFRS